MSDQMEKAVYAIATHAMYHDFHKEGIYKLAQEKLKLHHIAQNGSQSSLQAKHIRTYHEKNFWCGRLDAILKHHRANFGVTYLPRVLPSGTRLIIADRLSKKYSRQVEALLDKFKKQSERLEKRIKTSVKKR